MQCPSCNNEMVKVEKKNFKGKYNYHTLKCQHCSFMIFYNGMSEFKTTSL